MANRGHHYSGGIIISFEAIVGSGKQLHEMGNMMGQILPDGGALSIMTSSVQGMNSITIPWTVIRAKMERENQVNRAKFFAALIKYGPWAAGVAALAIGTSLAVQYSLEKIVGGI